MTKTTRVYVDCEFIRTDLNPRGTISYGLADENGGTYYAVNADMDEQRILTDPDPMFQWLRKHVWPLLPLTADGRLDRSHPDVKSIDQIRSDITAYFAALPPARLYAYFNAQDTNRLHALWDHDWDPSVMLQAVPRYCTDLMGVAEDAGITAQDIDDGYFPPQESTRHHALNDARYNLVMHEWILRATGQLPTWQGPTRDLVNLWSAPMPLHAPSPAVLQAPVQNARGLHLYGGGPLPLGQGQELTAEQSPHHEPHLDLTFTPAQGDGRYSLSLVDTVLLRGVLDQYHQSVYSEWGGGEQVLRETFDLVLGYKARPDAAGSDARTPQ
jgi:hypothetical protein